MTRVERNIYIIIAIHKYMINVIIIIMLSRTKIFSRTAYYIFLNQVYKVRISNLSCYTKRQNHKSHSIIIKM